MLAVGVNAPEAGCPDGAEVGVGMVPEGGGDAPTGLGDVVGEDAGATGAGGEGEEAVEGEVAGGVEIEGGVAVGGVAVGGEAVGGVAVGGVAVGGLVYSQFIITATTI